MQKKTVMILFLFIMLTSALTNQTLIPQASPQPTIQTEKPTYNPEESLSVSGTATPNTWLSIQLFNPNDRRTAIAQTKAKPDGKWTATDIYTFATKDPAGKWTLKLYDPSIKEWAETTFQLIIMPDTTLPKITINIQPEKTIYREETVTVYVMGDEDLKKATVSITQTGAPSLTLETSPTIETPKTWTGTYPVMKGYDGTAIIEAYAEDQAGNSTRTTKTLKVDTTPPKLTIVAPETTDEATITIKGTVDDPTITEVKLTIPPFMPLQLPVKTDLTWEKEITLVTGANTMTVEATDEAGNIGIASTITLYRGPLEILKEDVRTIKITMAKIESSITILSSLIIVAVVLSVVAAVAAILAVLTIIRRIVLK